MRVKLLENFFKTESLLSEYNMMRLSDKGFSWAYFNMIFTLIDRATKKTAERFTILSNVIDLDPLIAVDVPKYRELLAEMEKLGLIEIDVRQTPLDINTIDVVQKNNEDYENEIKQIVEYLNTKTGKSYRHNTKSTKTHIVARLKEKYQPTDFYRVIDNKSKEWKGTEYDKFLRPETLFGNKFESYLNQTVAPQETSAPTQESKASRHQRFMRFLEEGGQPHEFK